MVVPSRRHLMTVRGKHRGDQGTKAGKMMTSEASPRSLAMAMKQLKRNLLASSLFENSSSNKSDIGYIRNGERYAKANSIIPVPLEEAPLGEVLDGLQEFFSGMQIDPRLVPDSDLASVGKTDAAGLAYRRKLKRVGSDVEAAYGLGVWSSMRLAPAGQEVSSARLYKSLSSSLLYLLDGEERECSAAAIGGSASVQSEEICPNNSTGNQMGEEPSMVESVKGSSPRINIWNSVQDARQGIVRQAIAARFGYIRTAPVAAMMGGAPLIVFVRERMASSELVILSRTKTMNDESSSGVEVNHLVGNAPGEGVGDTNSEGKGGGIFNHRDDPARAWQIAALGMAVLTTVDADTPEHMTVAVDSHLTKEVERANMAPILVVLYAQHDSTLTAACGDLRAVCDSHNVRLHVEGPSISTVVHPEPPLRTIQLKESAHTLLVDPAAWLGITCCATATYHSAGSILADVPNPARTTSPSKRTRDGMLDGSISMSSSTSLGPTTSLWVFLARVGLFQIRSLVEEACQLSGVFIQVIAAIPNLEAELCGFGSTIKISYVMSRADRLMRKYRAREQVSRVNAALFSEVSESARALLMTLSFQDNQACIMYSPSRLLSSGSFWIPGKSYVHQFIDRLSAATTKYEMSGIGSSVFIKKVSNITDFEIVGEEEAGPGVAFCYGAFRITPEEIRHTWREHESELEVVQNLTGQLAETLAEELETYTSRKSSMYASAKRSLPFEFFLHAENEDKTPDYLTVEIEEYRQSPNVAREAEIAANIVLRAVTNVCQRWRGASGVPLTVQALGNVAGIEGYNPVESHEPLRCNIEHPQTGFEQPAKNENEEFGHCASREDDVEETSLRFHDEKADSELEEDREIFRNEEEEVGPPVGSRERHRHSDGTGINDVYDANAHARSHWFGAGKQAKGSRPSRSQTSRAQQNENYSEDDEDDESDEYENNDSSGDDGANGNGRRGNDEESGSEDPEEEENSDESQDEDEDWGSQSKRRSRRRRHVESEDESEEGAGEEEDEDKEELASSDDEYMSAENSSARGPRIDPGKPGLLGWLRGKRNVQETRTIEGMESAEDEQIEGRHRYVSSEGEEDEVEDGAERRGEYAGRDESDSGSGSEDPSDYSHSSASETHERRRRDSNPLRNTSHAQQTGNGSPVPSRFGFNWLSKKLVPTETDSRRNPAERVRAPRSSRRSDSSCEISLRSENSDSLSSSNSRMRDSIGSGGGRRSTPERNYSSSHSLAESERSDEWNEEEGDRLSGEGSSSQGSMPYETAERRRVVEHRASGNAKGSRGIMGWFSSGKQNETPRAQRTAPGRSRAISLSSGSSDYRPRSTSRQRATKRTTRGPREPSTSSSLLSWMGVGANAASSTQGRSNAPRRAQRSRR